MNYKFLALLACASLAACGGGGSGTATTDPVTPTPTPSAAETEAVKSFAESWTAVQLMQGLYDLQLIAGKTGNCPTAGTTAYASLTQTMTNCVRDIPNLFAYQGTYAVSNLTISGAYTSATIAFNGGIKGLNPSDLTKTRWTLTGGSVTGSNQDTGTSDITTLGSSSNGGNAYADFMVGSSAYKLTSFINTSVDNNYVRQLVNHGFSFSKGGVNYSLSTGQALNMVGNAKPNSGATIITYPSTLCPPPMRVTYRTATDFDLLCGTTTYSKKWTDTDIVAALTAAKQ
jgi:hypothetical protein